MVMLGLTWWIGTMLPIDGIVTPEVWDDAYSILMDSKEANQQPAKLTRHLLSGLMTCECGGKMYGRGDSPHVICNRAGGCRNRVPVVSLEHMLGELMTERITDPELATTFCAAATDRLKTSRHQLTRLQSRQQQAKETIQKAFDMVARGQMPDIRLFVNPRNNSC